MLFLANMLSKMKRGTALGSRIAEVHNGSSLFTGGAGQGESNIRQWIIENDWLEAIVALPLNMFYNTGIATYIWVLSNRKPEHRIGKVQLIDATQWFTPLRKNLGKKNCELSDKDIQRVSDVFLAFEETEESKIFANDAFGYEKVTVERPLRIAGVESERVYKAAEIKRLKEEGERDPEAAPVIRRAWKKGVEPDPLAGRFEADVDGAPVVVEYEPDPDLRDTEQVPLTEDGGVESFLRREVLPYAPDSWYRADSVKTGYEINFTRHFYKPKPMRSLAEIRADILATRRQADALLASLVAEPRPMPYGAPLRVYVATSVVGGCHDDEFREPSRRLFEAFTRGDHTLLLSYLTATEVEGARQAVQDVLEQVPDAHIEEIEPSDDADSLALAYIDAGALAPSMKADAQHIALATLGEADILVSWNFKHIVNARRIQICNSVNIVQGRQSIDIRSPREIEYHD